MSELGRGKRLLFLAVTFGLLWLVSELGAFALQCALRSTVVTPGMLQDERDRARRESRQSVRSESDPDRMLASMLKSEVVHPYLGFVADRDSKRAVSHGGITVNDYGLWSDGEFLRPRDPGRVVVGIFGGSVAFWFSIQGVDRLASLLGEDPRFAGKELEFVRVAWGGYKQPQQLLGLHYFLTLGAHFDLLINIDGFNEVALSYNENLAHGVSEVFPRSWHWRITDLPDPEIRRLMGLVVYTSDRRRQLASRFSAAPFRFSYVWNLAWSALDRRAQGRVSAALSRIQEAEKAKGLTTRRFAATGPYVEPESDAEAFERIAAQWRRASVQMHRTCEINGIAYYHFLQPNQYLPGSKPMGAEERAVAFAKNHPHRKPVVEGYPELIASANELRGMGVRFHDLTRVFADVEEPTYVDTCCHMGERGNEILAVAIAQAILSED